MGNPVFALVVLISVLGPCAYGSLHTAHWSRTLHEEGSSLAQACDALGSVCKSVNIPTGAEPKMCDTSVPNVDPCKTKKTVSADLPIPCKTTRSVPYPKYDSCKSKKKVFGKTVCIPGTTEAYKEVCVPGIDRVEKEVCEPGTTMVTKSLPCGIKIKNSDINLCSGNKAVQDAVDRSSAFCKCVPQLLKDSASLRDNSSPDSALITRMAENQQCVFDALGSPQDNKDTQIQSTLAADKAKGWVFQATGYEIDMATYYDLMGRIAACVLGKCETLTSFSVDLLKKLVSSIKWRTLFSPLYEWADTVQSRVSTSLTAAQGIPDRLTTIKSKVADLQSSAADAASIEQAVGLLDDSGTVKLLQLANNLQKAVKLVQTLIDGLADPPTSQDTTITDLVTTSAAGGQITDLLALVKLVEDMESLKDLKTAIKDMGQILTGFDPRDFSASDIKSVIQGLQSSAVASSTRDVDDTVTSDLLPSLNAISDLLATLEDAQKSFPLKGFIPEIKLGVITYNRRIDEKPEFPCVKIKTQKFQIGSLSASADVPKAYARCDSVHVVIPLPNHHVEYVAVKFT